jgi:hypothetical protein
MLLDIAGDQAEYVQLGPSALRNGVRAVRILHEVERLAQFDEAIQEFLSALSSKSFSMN